MCKKHTPIPTPDGFNAQLTCPNLWSCTSQHFKVPGRDYRRTPQAPRKSGSQTQLRVSPGAGERLCSAHKLLVLLHHCCARAAGASHLPQQLQSPEWRSGTAREHRAHLAHDSQACSHHSHTNSGQLATHKSKILKKYYLWKVEV